MRVAFIGFGGVGAAFAAALTERDVEVRAFDVLSVGGENTMHTDFIWLFNSFYLQLSDYLQSYVTS